MKGDEEIQLNSESARFHRRVSRTDQQAIDFLLKHQHFSQEELVFVPLDQTPSERNWSHVYGLSERDKPVYERRATASTLETCALAAMASCGRLEIAKLT